MNKTKLIALTSIMSACLATFASAGSLTLQADSQEIIKGCPTTINILVDTQDEAVGTAEARLLLNDSFTVNKFDSKGGVFRTYTPIKKVKATKGDAAGTQVMKFMGTTSSAKGYKGEGKFGSVTITSNSDSVDLNLYMVEDYAGDDSNLFVLNEEGTSKDVLTSVKNISLKVIDGECPVEALGEIDLSEPQAETVSAVAVEDVMDESVEVIEENVFDKSQENNILKKYRLYGVIVIAIILLIVVLSSLKKKKK